MKQAENNLSVQSLLPWNVRIVLYLFSFSSMVINKSFCVSACPYIDSIQNSELLFNFFYLSLIHIIIREILYKFLTKSSLKKTMTLPRFAHYLSVLSWIIIGCTAFILSYVKYPDFAISSHLKLLVSYWVLGAALITQLEYTIFEIQYKRKSKNADYIVFEEKIAKRVTESFFVLTIAPAITYLLILSRYQYENINNGEMIDELVYIIALCIAVALVNAKVFGDALKEDTKQIIDSIGEINKENYTIDIKINRADELGEISSAIRKMGLKIQSTINEIKNKNEQIENLLEKFTTVLMTAIDGKNIVTGYHCQRVPKLADMLISVANKSNEGSFKNFNLSSKDELRELRLAAKLHDCGKVTTPDHILDKGTKLDTLYNRIHEVRTRFEVIHRDLTIKALEKKLQSENHKDIDIWLQKEHEKLYEEFEFIAGINVKSDYVSAESINKVYQIASKEWLRYFDNTLGLSHEEERRVKLNKSKLPAVEKLLSDKNYHIVERTEIDKRKYDGLGFTLKVPENKSNIGELHNLSVQKGNLTEEDRYTISEHVMMTIKMLESLPFPENLKNVPFYAGTHHEKLNGQGYPRSIKDNELPIASKILSLADVFEALTASDRPYKQAKTISEAITILHYMVKDGEIDREVFELFLKNKIYLEFAKYFNFSQNQIDEVDIAKYLKDS